MSYRRRIEISPQTIISKLESEVNDLFCEIPVGLKPRLVSIQETIKLLSKQINSLVRETNVANSNMNYTYQYSQPYQQGNSAASSNMNRYQNTQDNNMMKQQKQMQMSNSEHMTIDENLIEDRVNQIVQSSQIENELVSLRTENKTLRTQVTKLSQSLSQSQSKMNQNMTSSAEYKSQLDEEKNNNKMLLLQVKVVEDNFKALSEKYEDLDTKHQELLNELSVLSKINSDMKKNTNENKYKYEDLIAMNSELQNKLVSYESAIKNHSDDLKVMMKKNATLTSKINELTKANKSLTADVAYKEERLKAIRLMNSKLEQQSKSLIKKWDSLSQIEQRSNQISQDANEAYDSIRMLSTRLEKEVESNKNLNQNIQKIAYEKEQLLQEINKIKNENKVLKIMNKEITDKYKEIEDTFKNKISESVKNMNSRSNMALSTNSKISSCIDNNSRESIPIEKLQPARFVTK